jgi:hypothetical protein
MKRIGLILMTTMLCISMASNAQPVVGKVLPFKFHIGLKVAGNFANLDGKEWETGYKPGFAGGLAASISRNRFGVSAEALFSSVKYTGSGVNFYNSVKATNGSLQFSNIADSATHGEFAVTSLSIPVLLNLKLAGPLWFQVGPQFSNIISISDKNKLLRDTKGLFKDGDVSGVLGLQLNIAKINIGARYIIGLSDVNLSSAGSTWKQRTIQLHLGWFIL